MIRRRKQRDNFVQSLFPFLAVLLSTMGALVLLLMLIVNQAQASAKQMAVDKKVQIEDAESNLQLLRESFEEQLEDRRLDLERKRLAIQHLEKHIYELIEELKGIERTSALLGQKQSQDKSDETETELKISQLEKQLTEANIDLKKKLEKPQGEKPIFAIIPYQGTNGTHRRPIYLECTSQGVTIRPEGVLIGLADLRPPYGPGNPLDAAIRTVRSRFAPANGALTSTAYPLLIVRPSGIRSYAMARQAMSGWDDQFGYELIDESLELTYPESETGLIAEINQALVLARERQAALAMAMPAKYRQYINSAGGSGDGLEFGDDAGDMGDEWAGGGNPSSGGGGAGSSSSAGNRGGYASSPSGGAQGQSSNNQGKPGPNQLGSQLQGFGGNGYTDESQQGGTSFFGQGKAWPPPNEGSYLTADQSGTDLSGVGQTGTGQFGTGGSQAGPGGTRTGEYAGSNPGTMNVDKVNAGSSIEGDGPTGRGGHGGASGAAGGGQSAGPSAGPMGLAGGSGSPPGGASGGGGGAAQSGGASSTPPDPFQDPTAQPNGPDQVGSPSLNMDMSRNSANATRESQNEPVARQRGRNWAWSEGPPSKTPVVRSIRVVCYSDRWVLMQDNATTSNQVTVPIGQSPQVSAEKLAKAISDRVSGWGIALGSGYWKPELVVDVAQGAENRYGQLERLLEGSGLSVRRRAPVK